MTRPIAHVVCPGCRQPASGMSRVGGEHTVDDLGKKAWVLCFHCGETYVVTMTIFGWVSRAATPAERASAAANDLLNFVRTDYADYRLSNPEVFGD